MALRFQVTRYDLLEVAFAPERRCWPTRRGRSVSRGGLPTLLPRSCSPPDSDSAPPSSDGSSPSWAAVASSAPPPSVSNLGGLCERPPPERRFIEVRRPTSMGERGGERAAQERGRSRAGLLDSWLCSRHQDPLEVTLGPNSRPQYKMTHCIHFTHYEKFLSRIDL